MTQPEVTRISACRPFAPTPIRQHRPRPDGARGVPHFDPAATPSNEQQEQAEQTIVCRKCRHVITAPAERIVVEGAHTHTFANPEGIVFEIGCFGDAWGCGTIGAASREFTWFADTTWRIAVCGSCLVHLGWRFSRANGAVFFGLILNRLDAPA